jgi:hypothetical protein
VLVIVKYYVLSLVCAMTLMACATSSQWRVNPVALEREVSNTLKLYPSKTTYRILIVPDLEAVRAEHTRIYGHPTQSPAFYSIRENLIVIPRQCELNVLRHEVGHAVVEAYFKAPVPVWLHEELAQRAEVH